MSELANEIRTILARETIERAKDWLAHKKGVDAREMGEMMSCTPPAPDPELVASAEAWLKYHVDAE